MEPLPVWALMLPLSSARRLPWIGHGVGPGNMGPGGHGLPPWSRIMAVLVLGAPGSVAIRRYIGTETHLGTAAGTCH